MKSSQIRAIFLDYFREKEHLVLPSFSLVPQNDPTLLLIGAGMAPFKPYFTGEKVPPHPRAATCQKCVRTPDIDKVGITPRHATFFEMLGNFSFGDYFKEEAISWAWELITQGYKLPEDRLYVSIYEQDDEAFYIWRDKIGLPESKIYRLGKEDNFWEIGLGPCGPCSKFIMTWGLSTAAAAQIAKWAAIATATWSFGTLSLHSNKEADGATNRWRRKYRYRGRPGKAGHGSSGANNLLK